MERYDLALLTKKIYDSGLSFFTLNTLKSLLEIKRESTNFNILQRLVANGVLQKIERNKYLLPGAKINDFSLANFIYQPSYISFESALNFRGILSQFPYEVTSATGKKTAAKTIDGKTFSYIHLKKTLFWGYEKKNDFLIAFPEKALLDQLYLASKGLKKANIDEYDLTLIDWRKLGEYLKKFPQTRQFRSILKWLPKIK